MTCVLDERTRKALPFRSPLTYLATLGPALKFFRNASACEPTDATAFLSSSSDAPKAFAQYCRSQGSLRFTLLVSGGPFFERSSPEKPPAVFTPYEKVDVCNRGRFSQ